MPSTRTDCRGFTLIELLVIVAVTASLFALLLPAAKSVRDAAASQAALELVGDKTFAAAALCTPPVCNSLDANFQAVHLPYPAIPADVQLPGLLASGLVVGYDSTRLPAQPFELLAWTDANSHDPGIVNFDLLAYSLVEGAYAIEAIDWLEGEVDFIVRNESGQAWKLRALIPPSPGAPLSVRVAPEISAVPEPPSLALCAIPMLALGVFRLRRASS